MWRFMAALAALLIVGCASQPRNVDGCDKEYANTLPHCQKRKVRTREDMKKAGMIEVCEVRGSYRACTWVTPEEVRRILRQYGVGQ